jgi:hypothetical protein
MTNQAIREQKKNFNAHRPFYRMRFRAADMDFAFQWVLGSSAHGGANVGESFYAASQMHDGDPATWEREWFLLAQRVHHRAEEALAKGAYR